MTGFGDGVRPPIMTGSDAKEQMDAFDPSLHEILGAETATLLNLDDAMQLEGGVDGIMTLAHPPHPWLAHQHDVADTECRKPIHND